MEPIRIRCVPSHITIGDGFPQCRPVRSKRVRIEIVLNIRRPEPVPIRHGQIVACPFQSSKKRSDGCSAIQRGRAAKVATVRMAGPTKNETVQQVGVAAWDLPPCRAAIAV